MDNVRRALHGQVSVILVRPPEHKALENRTMDGRSMLVNYDMWFVRPKLVSKLVLPGGRPIFDVAFRSLGDVQWQPTVSDWVAGRFADRAKWHTLRGHYGAIARALDAREGLPLALTEYLRQRPHKTHVIGVPTEIKR